jgi:hypothetical protein
LSDLNIANSASAFFQNTALHELLPLVTPSRQNRLKKPSRATTPSPLVLDALILVTPKLASLIESKSEFLSHAVHDMLGPDEPRAAHVCIACAVVDSIGRSSSEDNGSSSPVQQGLSTLVIDGSILQRSVIGAINNTSGIGADEAPLPSEASGLLSFHMRQDDPILANNSSTGAVVTLDMLPANTIFQNGRRSNMSWSRWEKQLGAKSRLVQVQRQDVTRLDINLQDIIDMHQSFGITAQYVALTPLRKIVAGVGNILRRLDDDGKELPASRELEAALPRYLEKRGKSRGTVDVWALVIPSSSRSSGLSDDYDGNFKTADISNLDWSVTGSDIRRVLLAGGRLIKVLSGGGGWGNKQGLLSLDPDYFEQETSSSDESLDWILGNNARVDDIAAPGHSIQFFIAEAPSQNETNLSPASRLLFGSCPEDLSWPESHGQSDEASNAELIVYENVFRASSITGVGLRVRSVSDGTVISKSKIAAPDAAAVITCTNK